MEVRGYTVPSQQVQSEPNTSHQATTQTGQFRGSPVVITNFSAMAANAAEEMSFAASEKAEKKMNERKSKDASSLDWSLYKIAQKYLAQVPDLKSTDRLHAFGQSLMQKSFTSAQQMLAHLGSEFKDVSHQYIALKFAREFIQKQGDFPGLLATIDSALAQLETEKGKEIRAGINVSKTAHRFAEQGFLDTQTLRDKYRDNVLNFSNVRAAARHLLDAFGLKRLGTSIRFLEQGLSADLNSSAASLPKSQLASIIKDLAILKQFRTVSEQAKTLFSKLKRDQKVRERASKQGSGQESNPQGAEQEEQDDEADT